LRLPFIYGLKTFQIALTKKTRKENALLMRLKSSSSNGTTRKKYTFFER